jgi:hypothetical protein
MGISEDDNPQKVRNLVRDQVVPTLRNTNTGTWERDAVDPATIVPILQQVLRILQNPQIAHAGVHARARLKHLWLYLDETADPPEGDDEDDA